MATFNQLPVYKASYDLFVKIFEFTQNFSRDYKHTLGEKLKNETIELMTNIYRANSRQKKSELIETARENTEVIRLLFRLIKDLKQISIEKFVEINEQIENISRQLTGWHKSEKLKG